MLKKRTHHRDSFEFACDDWLRISNLQNCSCNIVHAWRNIVNKQYTSRWQIAPSHVGCLQRMWWRSVLWLQRKTFPIRITLSFCRCWTEFSNHSNAVIKRCINLNTTDICMDVYIFISAFCSRYWNIWNSCCYSVTFTKYRNWIDFHCGPSYRLFLYGRRSCIKSETLHFDT